MTDLPVPLLDRLPEKLCWEGKVGYLAYRMKQLGGNEYPVAHIFTGGNYLREVQYPAGTLIIGRPHRLGHETHLVRGSVILCASDGRRRIDAEYRLKTPPGFQMVVQTLTQITAITVHPNPSGSRNIDELEAHWFVPEDKTLELGKAVHLRLEQRSYRKLIERVGPGGVELARLAQDHSDRIAYDGPLEVRKSPIHGMGVFALQAFEKGAPIMPLRIGDQRTDAGRYANHSYDPNAEAVAVPGQVNLWASRPIRAGEEVLVDYEQVYAAARAA